MKSQDYFKVEQLVKCKKPLWGPGRTIVRIAKRKNAGSKNWPVFTYFVTKPGDPVGYGTWASGQDLVALSALELLAMQLDD